MTAAAIAADLESLWYSHHERILNYVRYKVGPQKAEDITQDVFLHALEAMNKGIGYTEHASGWIYRIAHNLIIDSYRARDRYREEPLDAILHMPARSDGPEKLLERQVDSEMLKSALNRLTAEQQEALTLRYEEEHSFGEIAEKMDKTEGAVKALVHRGCESANAYLRNDTPRPRRNEGCKDGIIQALREHGPMTVAELAQATKHTTNSLNSALYRFPEIFARVQVTYGRKKALRCVWGLVGIHDQQEAA